MSATSSRDLAVLLSTRLQEAVPDGVAEATTEPWPGTGTAMPLPGAEVREGRLLAWFGDRDAPVLVIVADE